MKLSTESNKAHKRALVRAKIEHTDARTGMDEEIACAQKRAQVDYYYSILKYVIYTEMYVSYKFQSVALFNRGEQEREREIL